MKGELTFTEVILLLSPVGTETSLPPAFHSLSWCATLEAGRDLDATLGLERQCKNLEREREREQRANSETKLKKSRQKVGGGEFQKNPQVKLVSGFLDYILCLL